MRPKRYVAVRRRSAIDCYMNNFDELKGYLFNLCGHWTVAYMVAPDTSSHIGPLRMQKVIHDIATNACMEGVSFAAKGYMPLCVFLYLACVVDI